MNTPSLSSTFSESTLRGFPGSFPDASANLYDQQTAPILRKSLARTASTSSFHNGLAESRPSTSRLENPGVTSPGTIPSLGSNLALRPAMHTRSVTSPANNLFSPASTMSTGFSEAAFFSDDEAEESLSDMDERSAHNQPSITIGGSSRQASDGPVSLESMIRHGMRRLTGSSASSREKERQREILRAQQRAAATTASSPRVPKVPPEYLSGPTSSPASPGQ